MKTFLKYHLYIIGLLLVTSVAIFLNWDNPPNFDETHAWNIAHDLNPIEIFTISKTEGHPFLWYYILMPFAKTNFLYPWSLYGLNLFIILLSLFLLYKYAPLPTYLKYAITFSSPFLLLFSTFARSYSLSILLIFSLLSLYPKRYQKPILYLTLIILLANTNVIAFCAAFSLGLLYFLEAIYNHATKKTLIFSIIFGIIEISLIYLQFHNYDINIPTYSPRLDSLTLSINSILPILNIYGFAIILVLILYILAKEHCFSALSFLLITYIGMLTLFIKVYQGSAHHYVFFYIYLIATYWIASLQHHLNFKKIFPLLFIALCFIYTPSQYFKIKDKEFLQDLRYCAYRINNIFADKTADIIFIEPLTGSIITSYLDKNITSRQQTATDIRTLEGKQKFFYYFYKQTNLDDIFNHVKNIQQTFLFRKCEKEHYIEQKLRFDLKYYLNIKYCLYEITIN